MAALKRLLRRLSGPAIVLGTTVVALGLVEFGFTLFSPYQYIIPPADWVPEYGPIAYPDAAIVNAQPGVFRCVYTTNSARYRGPLIDPATPGRKVLLLGDSNIFGFGLNDDETISARMNELYGEDATVINLANGGWSISQSVRRYLELGQPLKPEAVVLHFAANDLDDPVYGIHWVAWADGGTIRLRNAPANPAGRLRKLLPPDSWYYGLIMRSQIMMRVKVVLNRNAMRVATSVDPFVPAVDAGNDEAAEKRVIVLHDVAENERRAVALLDAFARHLEDQGVRFIFLTDGEDFAPEKLVNCVRELAHEGLVEHHVVSRWFRAGVDYPASKQGHMWGPEAAGALAAHLYDVVENPQRGERRAGSDLPKFVVDAPVKANLSERRPDG